MFVHRVARCSLPWAIAGDHSKYRQKPPIAVVIFSEHVKVNRGDGCSNVQMKVPRWLYCTCIASIINNIISSGTFPDTIKTASVMPMLKSGIKDLAENYRPISILPTVSKIYERHIASQLQDYFSSTNVLHKTQSGFRKQHSCH